MRRGAPVPANPSPAANDDVAPASDELLHSCAIWDNDGTTSPCDSSTVTTSDQRQQSTEQIASPNTASPSSSFDSINNLSDADHSDSDFEVLDNDKTIHSSHNGPPTKHFDQLGPLTTAIRRKSQAWLEGDSEEPQIETPEPGGNNITMDPSSGQEYNDNWQQAGTNADAVDLAGPGAHGRLECTVTKPQKEGEGTQNSYVSYLVTTDTDFKSFQSSHSTARRRFTDFVFLYNALVKEYPQCAVPPVPDKHNMAYVRGDRFGTDFTARRAFSLGRFLKRLTLHPVLRRATILTLFLESSDWNATMRTRPNRGMSGSEASAPTSALDSWTDTFLNAFTKPHKTDKRFQEVGERAKKLDDDLGTVSKTVARVAKRESDLEADYADLAAQFHKLAALEPAAQDDLAAFATGVQATSEGWRALKEHTDRDYLGSLKDMESYILSLKSLLKTREQKQLDFEGLTEYLTKAAQERDTLASSHHGSSGMGASGFLRQKIEDVRGVDHEQSRRERLRKLEVQISRLTDEVEGAKKTTETFDEEVVKEVGDFERIKAVEFRDTLGGLAEANIDFFQGNIETWERFVRELEREGGSVKGAESSLAAPAAVS